MTFAYPLFLWLSAAAALAVVGLHYLTTMQQRPSAFPTTRFIPEQQVRYSTVSPRLSDRWLMLFRMLALLLLGFALAQPRFTLARSRVARIVMIDLSRSVLRNSSWDRDVAQATDGAAAIIRFDSTAEIGRLSPAMIEALRHAQRLRDRADSLELILIAPLVTGSTDDATLAIRAEWPGAIRMVRAPLADWPAAEPALVEWADSATSAYWVPRPQPDTVLGIQAEDATLIAPFPRRWILRHGLDSARVIGRWIDGAPAMIEQPLGKGCVRSIGFGLPHEGDATFRPEFDRFTTRLRQPCRHALRPAALPAAIQQQLAGGRERIAAASLRSAPPRVVPLTAWLLLIVTILLFGELRLRRTRADQAP